MAIDATCPVILQWTRHRAVARRLGGVLLWALTGFVPSFALAGATPALAQAQGVPAHPLRTSQPFSLVYDTDPIATVIFEGAGQVAVVRQYPSGQPFPADRWVSKVHRLDLRGRGPAGMAALLRERLSQADDGAQIASRLVAIDEVGREFDDDGAGPALLAAMRLLASERDDLTGEPLSRRVLLYVAPLFVAKVGSGELTGWRSALQAARLAGGAWLQMYHASGGRVTAAATSAEWRTYLPAWRRALGPTSDRLHVIFTGGEVPQAEQWRRARQTPAGRATLRNGAGAYRLGSPAAARTWLAHLKRFAS